MRTPLDRMKIRGGIVNNSFGRVRTNRNGTKRSHQGWDLYAPSGTTIYAIADGKVEFEEMRDVGDYGKQICISFPDPNSEEPRTLYAFYGHLSRVDKAAGDNGDVVEGDVLGATGTTGNASGMTGGNQHLHFEIRTVLRPGLGLAGRLDPSYLFGPTPL